MSKASVCVSSLQRMLDLSLTADVLAEELYSLPPDTLASVAKRELEHRGFDVAGVRDSESARVLRYVRTVALNSGDCATCSQVIRLEQAVAKMTPLRDCLRAILEHDQLFVLGREGIEGIITHADLEKQPVRLLFFGVISTLEMAMLELIRLRFGAEEWIVNPAIDLPRAQEVYDLRIQRNEETDLADCLQIGDKAAVLINCPDILQAWEFDCEATATEFFDRIRKVRNNLAHVHDPAAGSSWTQMVALVEHAQRVLDLTMEMIGEADAAVSACGEEFDSSAHDDT